MTALDQTALNEQRFLIALVVMLAVAVLLVGILVTPIYIWAKKSKSSVYRWTIALMSSYLIMMTVFGAYAYVLVPAQYTHYLRMSWPPSSSSSLWENTSINEQRLSSPGAINSAAGAEELRKSIDFERGQFLLRWVLITVALGVPLVLLTHRQRGDSPRGPLKPTHDSIRSLPLNSGGLGEVGPRDGEALIRA